MKKRETRSADSKTIKQGGRPPDNALKNSKDTKYIKRLETIVAILLGITTLISAWASWVGHLHGGNQSINFTESNNLASQGTAEYNVCMQVYVADYLTWNTLMDYYYDLEEAKADGNQTKADTISNKIENFKKQNIKGLLAEGVKWMEENNADSPFDMPGLTDKYFESAQEKINRSQEKLEEGKLDNSKGDSYLLVTVIYSLTLFLLGIIGTFKDLPNRVVILTIAFGCLLCAIIYMFTIPMPTGFDNMNFFFK